MLLSLTARLSLLDFLLRSTILRIFMECDVMNPLKRRPVNKSKSAKGFRKSVGKTKPANLTNPMRGGIRL